MSSSSYLTISPRSSQGAGDLLYLTGKRSACGRERPGFQTASICASHLPDRRLPCKEQITLIFQRNRSTHYEDPPMGALNWRSSNSVIKARHWILPTNCCTQSDPQGQASTAFRLLFTLAKQPGLTRCLPVRALHRYGCHVLQRSRVESLT
jgi:hypothetical protein